METVTDAASWAERTFGRGGLGDARLDKRLVVVTAGLAEHFGSSLTASAEGDKAAIEGAHRFVRNKRVDAATIAQAGFRETARVARAVPALLAVEDGTALSYTHSARAELGDVGAPLSTRTRGFLVQGVLLLDATTGAAVGLAGLQFNQRDPATRGKRGRSDSRPYEERESFKWQRSAEELGRLLDEETLSRTRAVNDREADIYEYLAWMIRAGRGFVTRAAHDRRVAEEEGLGFVHALMSKARLVGKTHVQVPQRGGRPARVATLEVRARRLSLRRPDNVRARFPRTIAVGVVWAREVDPPPGVEPLEWMLFTTEPVGTRDGVLRVLRWYAYRWRIEDFHKLWKSGAGVERCRMRSAANIERLATMLAFVAVRVMQLRDLFQASPEAPCDRVLSETEWRVLWATVEKTRPPKRPPSAQWAYRAIGRLAGWYDSKRTGRVGAKTLMTGWAELEAHVAGYEAFKLLDGGGKK